VKQIVLLFIALIALVATPTMARSQKPLVLKNDQPQQIQPGDTLQLPAATKGSASINIPAGSAPASPNNGDCWATSSAIVCKAGGAVSRVDGRVYPDQYGADDTCTNSATAAIAAAFAATHGPVFLRGCYRASATVVVPDNRMLIGETASTSTSLPDAQTRIVCDAAVSPCVQLGNGSTNESTGLRNLVVTRSGGRPAISTVGIRVFDGQNDTIVDVMSFKHGVCLKVESHPAVRTGIRLYLDRISTGACLDAHIWVDAMPEVRVNQGLFGQNGIGDYNANTYVRISGVNSVPGAGGPNTITFVNSQFNQGTNTTTHFMEFKDLAYGVPSVDAGEIVIVDSHIEGVSGALFWSDASWNILQRWAISNNIFNTPSAHAFALNAGSQPAEWRLTNNQWYVADFNLTPIAQIANLFISGGQVNAAMALTAPANSTAQIIGLTHNANATYAGSWGQLTLIGETFSAGSLSITGAGNITQVSPLQHALTAGGSTPTITSCGTSPAIDGRSTDNGGFIKTGGGSVHSCTITYSTAFPNIAFPVVTSANSQVGYWIYPATNTGFTINFTSSNPGADYIYLVQGK
jgi:hypothetical protein